MLIRLTLFLSFASLLFSSCEKEETPLKLPPKSDSLRMISATMGEHYTTQVFVNITTGEQWTADNNSWDIQLESSSNGYLIRMNGGKGALIGNTGLTKCTDLYNHTVLMKWDNSSGMKDSIAMGNWADPLTHKSYDSAYVIDRGLGEPNRFYEFQVKSVDASRYVLWITDMEGENGYYDTIPKDLSKRNIYYSFDDHGKVLNFEPEKDKWHFCFLRYRFIYYEYKPPFLYTVVGIHINSEKIRVAVDSTFQFSVLNNSSKASFHFSDLRDVIGFDWKVPVFSAGGVKYECRKFVNYIIEEKDNPGESYKLRFTDFYSDKGVKGSPKFEVESLH